jgi:hypothetical protein
MVWSVEWDGDFVVGGSGQRRLAPNFRLREFQRPDGGVRVHRELVSALQMLRDRFGGPMSVLATDGDGLGAEVGGGSIAGLLAAAAVLETHRLFETAERVDGRVKLRIPDPERLPAIGLEPVLESAFEVTSAFETGGAGCATCASTTPPAWSPRVSTMSWCE